MVLRCTRYTAYMVKGEKLRKKHRGRPFSQEQTTIKPQASHKIAHTRTQTYNTERPPDKSYSKSSKKKGVRPQTTRGVTTTAQKVQTDASSRRLKTIPSHQRRGEAAEYGLKGPAAAAASDRRSGCDRHTHKTSLSLTPSPNHMCAVSTPASFRLDK